MEILVFGAGYVGLSNAVMLASKNNVKVIDINKNKIEKLQKRISPISDDLIEKDIKNKRLKISFTTKKDFDLKKFKIAIIATPTDFNPKKKSFDTKSIEDALNTLKKGGYKNLAVIRSTIPIGFTEKMNKKYAFDVSYFPEFLREGKALQDNLFPSRIICGSKKKGAKLFLKALKASAVKKNIPTLVVDSSEAESIKLFSNTYLAMRIAFFNELDSFASKNSLDSENIINGLSLDPRIGSHYNNPSFGYGGYCLPKDSKQLKASFKDTPQALIQASIESNKVRKKFIIEEISKKKKSKIGIYRLSSKLGSDNFRESAIIDIIKGLKKTKKEIIIYEPSLSQKTFMGLRVEDNINRFKKNCGLIIANRIEKEVENIAHKIYSRDIFKVN